MAKIVEQNVKTGALVERDETPQEIADRDARDNADKNRTKSDNEFATIGDVKKLIASGGK